MANLAFLLLLVLFGSLVINNNLNWSVHEGDRWMKRLNFNSKWTKITLKHVHTPSMWIKAIYFLMRTLFMKHFKSIRCFYWISLKWHNTVWISIFTFPQIIAHILKHTLFSWMKIDFTLMARKIQHWRWWWKKK